MKKLIAIILSAVIITALIAAVHFWRKGGEHYNLLLITLDTTRADHLGCYGFAEATTPALDVLARSGVKFTRAYCNAPLTLPSHATMMTGLYPAEHGLRVNGEKSLAENVTTLAQIFASHGYRTAAFIAAFVLESRFGLDRGFQTYEDYDAPEADEIFDDTSMYRYRSGNKVADSAVSWIRKNRRRPFFCWVHFFDPHRPYYPHPAFDGRYRDSPYDSEVAFMDTQVGRLIEGLKKNKLLERTVIVVAGDHGEGLGEHGEIEHGLLLYNSSMRVPLIVSCPGRIPREAEVEELISIVDLFPTILELFGWMPQEHTSGRSFAAALSGEPIRPRPVYAETEFPLTEYGWSPLQGVIAEEWKYIRAPREELYNLREDPRELKNMAVERPEVTARLKTHLASLESEMVKYETSDVKMDKLSREILASLGYVGGGGSLTKDTRSLRDPKDVIELRSLFIEATGDIERGNIVKAEASLRKLIKESPETYAFRSKLAKMFYDRGMYEKAAEKFKEIAEMAPDKYGSHYNLGKALIKVGSYDEAIQALRRALEIYPDETSAHNNLGIALLKSGRFNEATDAFRTSLSIKPDQGDALNNLGNVLLALGRYDEAAGEFRSALKLTPDFFEARYNLGLALFRGGRYREAAREFRQAIRLRPGFGPAREKLNMALTKSREQKQYAR